MYRYSWLNTFDIFLNCLSLDRGVGGWGVSYPNFFWIIIYFLYLQGPLVECKFLLSHLDKEVQFFLFNPSSIHLQLERYLEREQQLVPLEDPRTSVVIHVVCQRVHYILQPFLYDAIGHALAQRELENIEERYERILVHRIDRRHLGENKEQDGATLRRRSIPVPRLVDLLGSLRSELQFLADLNDRSNVMLCRFACTETLAQ